MLTLARGHICPTLEGQGCLSQKLPFSVSMSADPSKNPDQKELVSRSTKKRQTNSILFLFLKKLEFLSDFHLYIKKGTKKGGGNTLFFVNNGTKSLD